MPSLEDQIVALIDARIARALGASRMAYSTERPELYPPGKRTRRAARDAIRSVPGHERDGRGRGTVWRCTRDAYAAHHGRTPTPLRLVATSSDEEIAERALRGTRATRAS